MKILQMCESFGGGNFSSVTQICNGLAARGFTVHLAFSRRAETPPDLAACVHPAVVMHELRMTRQINPLKDARSLLETLALMRRVKPDIVHLHSSKAGFIGRVAALLLARSRAVFYSPRGLSFLQQDVSGTKRRAYLALERMASHLGGTVVACSRGELEQVRDNLPASRAVLIENAVDVTLIPPKAAHEEPAVRIGTAGRVTAARNPRLFAAIARRLRAPGVQFVWIGGGDAEDARRLEDAGVIVTGWLARAQALEHLSALDIYLQTSLWEGMPVSVIEAQVAGIPAVVTDILGNRDVVRDGETGYVCASEARLVERLEELIGSDEARARMGARSRELSILRFGLDRLLDELLAAYRAALK